MIKYNPGDPVDPAILLQDGDTIDPNGDYPVCYPNGTFKRYTKGYAILELQDMGLLEGPFRYKRLQ